MRVGRLGVATVFALLVSWVPGLEVPAGAIEFNLARAIEDASATVRARQALHPRSDVVSSLGLSRFYKPGDNWLVEVRYLSPGMVRKTSKPEALRDSWTDPLLFAFKVTSISAEKGEATVEVTPVSSDGKPREQRIAKARIALTRSFKLASKDYSYRDLELPVKADLDEPATMPMGFDSFPIELPDLENAKVSSLDDGATTIESSDLLMRPVRAVWKRGDLWPERIETHNAIVKLVRQEKL